MSDPCTCSWGAPHGDPCEKWGRVDADEHEEYTPLMREQAYKAGAAVAFGLMGMAEAIREREHLRAWCNGLGATACPDRSKDG